MKTTFIYILSDPTTQEIKYVGKSNRPKERFYAHLRDKKITHKRNWIKSLLAKGLEPELEIIDEVNENEWQFWEMYYISLYKSWGFKLTNCDNGGGGPGRCSYETKLKIGLANKGKKRSKETRKKLSLIQKGKKKKPHSQEEKKAKSLRQKGVLRSKEVKEKLKTSWRKRSLKKQNEIRERLLFYAKQLGRVQTKERVEIRSVPQRVKVLQKDLQGNLIKEWEGIAYAAKILGIAKTSISSTLQGNLKRAGGFIWEYKDKSLKEQQTLKYKNRKQLKLK